MTLEEFTERHGLKEILSGYPIPPELRPHEPDDEDNFRFFVNEARSVGLGLNDTKEEIRVVFAELGLADTGWIPRAEAFAVADAGLMKQA